MDRILITTDKLFDLEDVAKSLKKNKKNGDIMDKEMKKYLESVQKDINNLLSESEQQTNEAKEISNTISPYSQSCINDESLLYDWKITEDGRLIRFVVE